MLDNTDIFSMLVSTFDLQLTSKNVNQYKKYELLKGLSYQYDAG